MFISINFPKIKKSYHINNGKGGLTKENYRDLILKFVEILLNSGECAILTDRDIWSGVIAVASNEYSSTKLEASEYSFYDNFLYDLENMYIKMYETIRDGIDECSDN